MSCSDDTDLDDGGFAPTELARLIEMYGLAHVVASLHRVVEREAATLDDGESRAALQMIARELRAIHVDAENAGL